MRGRKFKVEVRQIFDRDRTWNARTSDYISDQKWYLSQYVKLLQSKKVVRKISFFIGEQDYYTVRVTAHFIHVKNQNHIRLLRFHQNIYELGSHQMNNYYMR